MSIAKGFCRLKQEWAAITGQQCLTIGRFLEDCSLVIMERIAAGLGAHMGQRVPGGHTGRG